MAEEKDYGPNYIGNVIRILDEHTLLVNVGSDCLSLNDEVIVYTIVEPIYDLDGSLLCMYEYQKDKLKVTEVTDKYSICKKTTTKAVEAALASALTLSPLFGRSSELMPLNVNQEDIFPLKKVSSVIEIGDPIKKV